MKLSKFFTAWFILLSTLGWADIDVDTQDIGSEEITEPAKSAPFSVNTYIDVLGPSKITEGFFKDDQVHFAQAQTEAGMVVYYCKPYEEGARIALGYTATYLKWAQNPWFDQDHFNILSLAFTGFTKRVERWFWRYQLSINVDTHEWKTSYTSYDLILWGRYAYCGERIGVHLGVLAQTGLNLDRVYPIIGFDWKISPKWKLNVIYPLNVSLIYALAPRWSLALAARTFNSRFRVHHDEIFSHALLRYTNTGVEFSVRYETKNVSANIHAGATFGGKYRVANQNNHHAHTYNLASAGYVGGEVDIAF